MTDRTINDRLAEALYRAAVGPHPAEWERVSAKRNWRKGAKVLRDELQALGLQVSALPVPIVEASCGCVYCDLGLLTYEAPDGSRIHEGKTSGVHVCTRRSA